MKLSKASKGQIYYYNKYIRDKNKPIDLRPYFTKNVYTDFSNEADYHGFLGLSQSQLKNGKRSMNSYFFRKYLEAEDRKTKDMNLGDFLHKTILEPHLLDNFITDDEIFLEILDARPEVKNVRSTTEYKNWLKLQSDKTIITKEQKKNAEYMLESVYSHPLSKELLQGLKEKVALVYDEESGLFRRCKFDLLFPGGYDAVLDVKKCQNIDKLNFSRSVFDWEYYFQVYEYPKMASIKFDRNIKDFIFLAIESNPPFECAYYKASDDMKAAGKFVTEKILGNIISSYEKKKFEIENKTLQTLNLPYYAEDKIDLFLSKD